MRIRRGPRTQAAGTIQTEVQQGPRTQGASCRTTKDFNFSEERRGPRTQDATRAEDPRRAPDAERAEDPSRCDQSISYFPSGRLQAGAEDPSQRRGPRTQVEVRAEDPNGSATDISAPVSREPKGYPELTPKSEDPSKRDKTSQRKHQRSSELRRAQTDGGKESKARKVKAESSQNRKA